MHVRFSTCVGMPVVEEAEHAPIGAVQGILLHPDTGVVEGLFVASAGLLGSVRLLLASRDIARWGQRITIRDAAVLCPLEDHVRLSALVAEGRPVLGQRVVTEEGVALGRCRDVQLSTTLLQTEWIFAKRLLRREIALPMSDVVEVRRDAVVVRTPLRGVMVPGEIVPAQPTFA